MEFPLYQYLSGLLYHVFDLDSDVPGKLISIISVIFLLFILIQLAKTSDIEISAESITIVLFCLPFVFFYATAFMPELFALALSITGLYYFYQYRSSSKVIFLVTATIFLSIASLTRPFLIFLCYMGVWKRGSIPLSGTKKNSE